MRDSSRLIPDELELIFKPSCLSGEWFISPWAGFKMLSTVGFLCVDFLVKRNIGHFDPPVIEEELFHNFATRMLEISRTTLYARGRRHIVEGNSYIYMSNHVSIIEAPVLFKAVPGPLRLVVKTELFQVPLLGLTARQAGLIEVDRHNREKAIEQLRGAKEKLDAGRSIWIAPEGKRSPSGELLPFKKGGFYLAIDLKRPIIPLWIEGAGNVIPADSAWVKPNQTITLHFGAPIPTAHLGFSDCAHLMEITRNAILQLACPA